MVYEIFYNPYKALKTNHFHKFPKAKPSWSVEVKFEAFSKPWTRGGSACYAQTTHSALGKHAMRIISEPKKFHSFVQIHAKLPPTACK